MTEEIFSHPVAVELQLRVDPHHIADKVEIAEGNTGLQGVYGDTAVGAQHIIHVKLIDPLLAFQLEGFRGWRKIRILVAEEFVGNLARHQNPDVGGLMDGLAA